MKVIWVTLTRTWGNLSSPTRNMAPTIWAADETAMTPTNRTEDVVSLKKYKHLSSLLAF